MVVVIIDGSTIRAFVNKKAQFHKAVGQAFTCLDLNRDGVVSRSELLKVSESLRLIESHFGVDVPTLDEDVASLHRSFFDSFDRDKNGYIDEKEFADEVRTMLLAIADGLGFCPVQMALEDGDEAFGFLKRAVELEASKGFVGY